MIELKFSKAQDNWLEATWTDVVQLPDVHHPAQPALFDADGNEVQAAVPEHTTPGEIARTELKHTSYHPTQLDLLQADAAALGTSLDEHAEMLAAWVASYVPPPPEPEPVPQVVSMRQARRALNSVGLLDDVEAVVATRPKDDQIEWEFATEVRRDYPLLAAVQVAAGLTDAQVDDLFRLASTF